MEPIEAKRKVYQIIWQIRNWWKTKKTILLFSIRPENGDFILPGREEELIKD